MRAPAPTAAPDAGPAPLQPDDNRVFLTGRLPAAPEERELPSGDTIVVLRLVVRRPADPRGGPTVDTVDCVVRAPGLQRRVLAWAPGTTVSVEGALRRRFWRSAGGPASRTEVLVDKARLATRGRSG
ncbi:single-strand DNA-binding protein [Motilibacter rhizosphaerae]|uniref:Single-strand DNA-binding protein n=1 Tax=Motilibacter rhizosphaerae TaxID=598652 RepID=A0A4Q7NBF9_9ACTN|nr:single-stranded DNA-binding protein [Motilibacter rhizosphaerae]RZS80239.1 single-strand DNA-binding protein [Motilibacter rhizosphaerae]